MLKKYEEIRVDIRIAKLLDGVGGALAHTDLGESVYISSAAVRLFDAQQGDRFEAKLTRNRASDGAVWYAARVTPSDDLMPDGMRQAVTDLLSSDLETYTAEEAADAVCGDLQLPISERNRSLIRAILESLYDDGLIRKGIILDRGRSAKVVFSASSADDMDIGILEPDDDTDAAYGEAA